MVQDVVPHQAKCEVVRVIRAQPKLSLWAHPAASGEYGDLEHLANLLQELLQEGAPLEGCAGAICCQVDLLVPLRRIRTS